jgi:hydroxyethylthiazole kinase-like uncharacterized protein yjeF
MSSFTSEVSVSGTVPRCYGRAEVYAATGAESAAFDRWAIEEIGIPGGVLMENAGRGAALVLSRVYSDDPVLVVAGSGNNGGDGIVLARTLAVQGRDVRLLSVGRTSTADPLLHGWPVPLEEAPEDEDELAGLLESAGVLVDALLGTGIRGAPRERQARVIRALNRAGAPVVALDIPSGVDANSGDTPGEAVRADLTIAFGAPKLGTLLFPGREHAGRIVALEIGFPPQEGRGFGARVITPEWAESLRPHRPLVTHKKAEGRLLIVAGSPGVAGAAVLAARGALRAGAGYVRVASHPENREILQRTVPEAIFVDVTASGALEAVVEESDALAAGPGMGLDDEAAARLDEILKVPVLSSVLDADALTLLGAGRLPSYGKGSAPERRLLTPHPGEMARLGPEVDQIRQDPVGVCREGAARWGSALLLKGQPSLVADSADGTVWVSTSGSSDLARAGVGDVLTGVTGAFLARGKGALDAGVLALHFTGRAAELTGRGETLLPSDIAEHLSAAFEESRTRTTDLELPFVILDLDPAH